MDKPAETLLTVREVATWLGISTMSCYRLLWHGELAFCNVGRAIRIRPADVEGYLSRVSHSSKPDSLESRDTGDSDGIQPQGHQKYAA
jgi:excisionase family DNA binding protein